jgi:hypothetical protein
MSSRRRRTVVEAVPVTVVRAGAEERIQIGQ